MSRFRKGQNNPFTFGNYTNDSKEFFEYTMSNLLDSMYDVPSETDLEKIVVEASSIKEDSKPLMVYRTDINSKKESN